MTNPEIVVLKKLGIVRYNIIINSSNDVTMLRKKNNKINLNRYVV